MDKSLIDILRDTGLSDKEALVYMTNLQLGQAPVSTIARHMHENRVTVYSILKNLIAKGLAKSATKKNTTYYSVIEPEKLAKKAVEKAQRLESIVPQLMAMATKIDTPVKTQFFEGLEWIKTVYENVILSGEEMPKWEPFLAFVGACELAPELESYFAGEFIPRRLKFPTKTMAIISNLSNSYAKYNYNKHDAIVLNDELFDFANEIIICWKDQVVLMMYAQHEMSALVIHSSTLHEALKAMFHMIRKMHKALHKKK